MCGDLKEIFWISEMPLSVEREKKYFVLFPAAC